MGFYFAPKFNITPSFGSLKKYIAIINIPSIVQDMHIRCIIPLLVLNAPMAHPLIMSRWQANIHGQSQLAAGAATCTGLSAVFAGTKEQ